LQVLLRRACAAIRNAADPLRVELALSRCVGALFAEASEGPGPCAEPRLGDWRVKRVREMIHDGAGDALRLEPLASEVGLSAARLVTLFRQCTSLPVHQYITALRLTKVMRQMARGVSPSDAAIASGFYDLSHLGRLMRRHIGTTPSAYFAAVHR
jgi:AraC-like DNA-binding protein